MKKPINQNKKNMKLLFLEKVADKKTSRGQINWVLLDGIGNAVTNNRVPDDYVMEALDFVLKDSSEEDELGIGC